MAGFVFKLEPVLDQRLRTERERQLAVAELESQRLAIEQRIRRAQQAARTSRAEVTASLSGGRLDMRTVRQSTSSSLRDIAQTRRDAVELAAVHERLAAARRLLAEAMAARRAVELLRERRLAEWKRGRERIEMALVDDIVTTRHGRRTSEESSA
ncbi:MAG: hypothetical protein AAF747_00455 [Planctomycetota bacterium]